MASRYTQPPTNYLGSGLFLSYIVAALGLTIRLAHKIYHAHLTHPERPTGPIVTFLLLTFVVMSVNMISVLVNSYVSWARAQALASLVPDAHHLGRWMLESSLFGDFASDLLASPAVVLWSQMGLLWTLGASMWMATGGRMRGIDGWTMAEVFAVAQILPVSSSMQMFMLVAVLHTPSKGQEKEERRQAQEATAGSTNSTLFYALNAISLLYFAALFTISSLDARDKPSFTGLAILVTRSCLVAPFALSYLLHASSREELQEVADSTRKIFLAGSAVLVARQIVAALRNQGVTAMFAAWNVNAPVRTLIMDMALGFLGMAFWGTSSVRSRSGAGAAI